MTISKEVCVILSAGVVVTTATSVKMDFYAFGNARTDPLLDPTCLSDHVHTFYGAKVSVRPELTYEEMRRAPEPSGGVEENLSLYWHPTIYSYDSSTELYQAVPIWFASAYYIWQPGQAKAFPNGFNMLAYGHNEEARAQAECVDPYPCERDDCSTPDDSTFPANACGELELRIVFPTCWDGISVVSQDMTSHVSYDTEGGWFDADCPSTHPVKIPEIQFYFRIRDYKGGHHVFSNNHSTIHADYFSGWEQIKLQQVLDNCHNEGDAALPNFFCEDHLTYRDRKETGRQGDDSDIAASLDLYRTTPDPNMTCTVSPDPIDNITTLPRGSCTGTLVEKTSIVTCRVNDKGLLFCNVDDEKCRPETWDTGHTDPIDTLPHEHDSAGTHEDTGFSAALSVSGILIAMAIYVFS